MKHRNISAGQSEAFILQGEIFKITGVFCLGLAVEKRVEKGTTPKAIWSKGGKKRTKKDRSSSGVMRSGRCKAGQIRTVNIGTILR